MFNQYDKKTTRYSLGKLRCPRLENEGNRKITWSSKYKHGNATYMCNIFYTTVSFRLTPQRCEYTDGHGIRFIFSTPQKLFIMAWYTCCSFKQGAPKPRYYPRQATLAVSCLLIHVHVYHVSLLNFCFIFCFLFLFFVFVVGFVFVSF